VPINAPQKKRPAHSNNERKTKKREKTRINMFQKNGAPTISQEKNHNAQKI